MSQFAALVRPITVSIETLLPDPDSPTTPSILPGLDGERDAVHRLHHAVLRGEAHAQVLNVQQRHQKRTRGSR